MISKSPKEIYQKTSKNLQDKDLDVSEEVVKEFNLFLFGKINAMLMSFEHLELYVPHLGTWKFRRKKGEEIIARGANIPIEERMMSLHGDEELAKKARITFTERTDRIKRLIKSHEEMIHKKLAFKKIRNEYSASKGSIEESIEDIRGPQE